MGNSASVKTWLANNIPWLLILSSLVLLSTKTLFNVPVTIMALVGFYQVACYPGMCIENRAVRLIIMLFLCLWLPMLVSLYDAVAPSRSIETVVSYIRYPFAGIFIVKALTSPIVRDKIQVGVVVIISFWCIDALIQFFTGTDLFGYPYNPPQLTGMFYPKVRLGYILAVLSPFMFEYVRQKFHGSLGLVLIIIPICAVILLSGKRVAWMMFFVAVTLYLIYLWITLKQISPKVIIISIIFGLGTSFLLYTYHQPFQNRFDQSLAVFSANYEQADIATARRLDLWRTSIAIFKENWVNGTGPRSFREIYSHYASADNFWMKDGRSGQTHPHQFLMEIAAETGSIGIIGYLSFWLVLAAMIWRGHKSGNTTYTTCSLCVVVAMFPLNSHLAFYGSYWSSFIWLILPISVAWLHTGHNLQCKK